ncbi:ribosome hibernation-promoting factor, HPF/YfiA family [Adhaeribacter radiodurans]|uniref:Ribosome-associated translation inhibitor RaiA n=1 Tax=Adhaeribacter radiodurans TaxID=2745197 RepID=A0A7L7LEP6_9BACT|nr:ribosome-associated translation inhibitor RaiA [Adhaeribacter radiodurans]QMU31318.1 ribosome-associated translation inhibitor RaiA [Adhaeribacter radiodurans]
MKLQINAVNFDARTQLQDFVQQKVNKLETFYDRIIEGEVFLKLDNNNQIANKIVEIKLFVPGSTLFTKEEADSFETATDKALDSMTRQLKKYKDKITTH